MTTRNCFEIPKLQREIKRTVDLAESYFQVSDPVRGDISFIESILLSAFPKTEVFQNCLESFMSKTYEDDGNKLRAYYEILNEAYADRVGSFAVFAAERKFTGKFNIDPAAIELNILDQTIHPIVKTNYTRFLLDNMSPHKLGIPGMYQNEDDLLYDIYVATEMADFLNSYDYRFYSNREMLNVNRQENPYHKTFFMFEHCDAAGKTDFSNSLLEKNLFLKSFKTNPESYKKVISEINEPYQFIHRSWNNTLQKRKDYAVVCIKITVFIDFFHRFVEPKIRNELTQLYTSGNGDPKFENNERAIDFMLSKFGELVVFLYNPYKDISHELEMLDRVYAQYTERKIQTERPEIIRDLNSVMAHLKIPVSPIPNNPPMELVFKKKKTVIKVYADRTEPVEFSYMALQNTDVPFVINEVGLPFNSVKEFMTFATLESVFGMPKEQSYSMRGNFGLIFQMFQETVACAVKDAITISVDQLMKSPDVHAQLSKKPKTTGYTYTLNVPKSPFFDFFSNYLTTYITNTAPSTEIVTITNPVILNWIEKRQKHLQQIFFAVREHSKVADKIKKRDALFNLFSLVFCLDRVESTIKIHAKAQDKLMDDCELYVREELSFVLGRTGVSEDDLAELLQHNGESVSEKYSVFSTHNAHTVVESLYRKISPYILKQGEEAGEINYNLCLSIILGKKVKGATRENLPEKITENPKLLHALKLLYHLYISQDA